MGEHWEGVPNPNSGREAGTGCESIAGTKGEEALDGPFP